MSEISKVNPGPFIKRQALRLRTAHWPLDKAAIGIPVFLALAVAAYFLGRHLFDLAVPAEGDVRSHIFKIEILHYYLSQFSWPQWIPWWYHGIPMDQYYPPGFYFLGALGTYIFGSAVIAYKVLLLLAMMLNGLSIYYLARRFFHFDSHLAVWCLLAYEASTPLLLNFIYGEGPNLLGWCSTIVFLTVYLTRITENRTSGLLNIIWPGFLLGISILIHPFPVIFAVMVVALFHIIWLIHTRAFRVFFRSHLSFIALVFLIGGFIGAYYWLPALLTLHYSSPIYSFTEYMWFGGVRYLLVIVFLALAAGAITRWKIRGNIKLDFLIVAFGLAAALGFRATNYLPFGLGSLVQEFRFATIVIPFFAVLLIAFPLKYKLFSVNMAKLAIAIAISLFVIALIFGLDKREAFASGYRALTDPVFKDYYHLAARLFAADFPGFAVALLPYFVVILFLALSLGRKFRDLGRSKPAVVLAGGACLLVVTSFVPYINTNGRNDFNRIFNNIDYYRQPYYGEVLEAARGGRLILPPGKGYLIEGDSLVVFAWRWGVETVNGPYNQGDPKFFKSTVHMEWEERWLDNQYTRQNLMQESAAKYIFIRGTLSLPGDLTGMNLKLHNEYGRLLELNESVSYANRVTPVMLDVDNPRDVTEFFNILLPGGYKMVLVDVADISADMHSKFDYVMVDSEARAAAYAGKTIFRLNNADTPSIVEGGGVVNLNMPYLSYTDRLFYHGEEADGYWWIGWDNWAGSRITPDIQANLTNIGKSMAPYLDKLGYAPVENKRTDNRTALTAPAGFTLVKDSYFPYWKSSQGNIMPTSQGFMLVYAEGENPVLQYKKPGYYIFATVCTLLSLAVMIGLLIASRFYKPWKTS